jgi:hypothetical protein
MRVKSINRNELFNPGRFFLLIKRDIFTYYRTIIIATAAIAGFVVFSSALSALNHNGGGFHLKFYFFLLYIGGFIFTSRGFRELYNSQKSYTYVTLPGSLLEKFIEKWLLTSIGYALGSLIIYTVIAAISESLNQMLFGYTHALLSPFNRVFLIGVAAFIVIQGIFLTGAVFFKKNALIKTILLLTLFAIVLLVLTIFAASLISPEHFERFRGVKQEINSTRAMAKWLNLPEFKLMLVGKTIWQVIRILFWSVLAPFCWFISYLKFRKIEV